jgi:hypothetical protein
MLTVSICSSTLSCWLCTASNEYCCIQAKVGLKDNALRYFSSWRPLHPCRHKCPPLLYTMLRQDKHTFGACPGVECRHYKMHIPLEMYIGCKHKLIAAFINLTAGHVWSCTLENMAKHTSCKGCGPDAWQFAHGMLDYLPYHCAVMFCCLKLRTAGFRQQHIPARWWQGE